MNTNTTIVDTNILMDVLQDAWDMIDDKLTDMSAHLFMYELCDMATVRLRIDMLSSIDPEGPKGWVTLRTQCDDIVRAWLDDNRELS